MENKKFVNTSLFIDNKWRKISLFAALLCNLFFCLFIDKSIASQNICQVVYDDTFMLYMGQRDEIINQIITTLNKSSKPFLSEKYIKSTFKDIMDDLFLESLMAENTKPLNSQAYIDSFQTKLLQHFQNILDIESHFPVDNNSSNNWDAFFNLEYSVKIENSKQDQFVLFTPNLLKEIKANFKKDNLIEEFIFLIISKANHFVNSAQGNAGIKKLTGKTGIDGYFYEIKFFDQKFSSYRVLGNLTGKDIIFNTLYKKK